MSRDEKGTDIRVAKGKVNKIDLAKLDSRETYRLLHKGTLLEDHLSVERLGREAAAAGAYADQDTVVNCSPDVWKTFSLRRTSFRISSNSIKNQNGKR